MHFLGDLSYYILKLISLGQSEKIAQYIAHKLGYEDCGCNKRRNQLNNWLVKKENKTYKF
jgi:hypothetical protein